MNCQKCRTPLRPDPSLQDLNPASFDLLVGMFHPTLTDGRLMRIRGPDLEPISEDAPGTLPLYSAERREKYEKAAQHATSPVFKQTVQPRRGIGPAAAGHQRDKSKDVQSMSFVMLSDSQVASPKSSESAAGEAGKQNHLGPGPHATASARVDYSARLFEILSSRTDIDHPICTECTELVLSSLQTRLMSATRERDAYINCLKDLKTRTPSEAEVTEAEKQLANAKIEEEKKFNELVALENEKYTLEEQLAELDAEARELDREEEDFWRNRNSFDLRYSSMKELKDALEASYQHDIQQLERLRRTNVYNDTFCIGHDGYFGTINGLRLGRLAPPNNVEWAEINAAWGYTALLLRTIAQKLGFQFQGYNIKPMGSTSHIERLEHREHPGTGVQPSPRSSVRGTPEARPKVLVLELYSSGDLPLGRQILHRKFNEAMVAFLECIRQLGDHVSRADAASHRGEGLKLPYSIEKDRINGISIKLGVSPDEQWTSACKYTLTCCKFLLAHASNEKNRRES